MEKDLKIQALLERISTLTTEYENKIADLRVEVTLKSYENDNLNKKLEEYTNDKKEDDGEVPEL